MNNIIATVFLVIGMGFLLVGPAFGAIIAADNIMDGKNPFVPFLIGIFGGPFCIYIALCIT